MNSACCRIYNDNIGAGPVLRDLHVLRKEWQTVSSASSFLWEIKDSLGWPPLSKVLGVSTLKALLTSTLETSLFPSMWSLLFISEKPLQQTHPSPRQPLPNGTVQIFWTVSGLFWCFVSGHLLALGWHSVHVQSSTSVTKIDWPTLTFVFCNHCCLWFKKKKKKTSDMWRLYCTCRTASDKYFYYLLFWHFSLSRKPITTYEDPKFHIAMSCFVQQAGQTLRRFSLKSYKV